MIPANFASNDKFMKNEKFRFEMLGLGGFIRKVGGIL